MTMSEQIAYTTPARVKFRELMERPGLISQPAVFDPLGAKIAQDVGFEALNLGGYAMGAHLASTEPMLSLNDVCDITRHITRQCSLPLMVDAGAGWGEPLHVMNTVRQLEQAGASSIHMEDQIYPKRVGYHKGVEHLIELDQMIDKIKAAVAARRDPNFVIVARTDAIRTHGYDEGVRRAAACVEAGAEIVMIFPDDKEQTQRLPQDLPDVPLLYVNSTGNRFKREVFTTEELEEWGWKFVNDAISLINVTAQAMRKLLVTWKETGEPGLDPEETIRVRNQIESTIGLDEYYRIEDATVENK
jgi:methylisocitrate lyase